MTALQMEVTLSCSVSGRNILVIALPFLLLSGFFCLSCKRHQLVLMVEAAASVVSGDCSYEQFSVIK